ncbi:PAS domain S-box protein [Anoxynatronum sibiricum]|uniref:Stage 0 sporulation protein A homolog n=1 Tax=Anoxynatronum sibiricum TaxID=210623 RepID=A0ABU9VV11_9CLOT
MPGRTHQYFYSKGSRYSRRAQRDNAFSQNALLRAKMALEAAQEGIWDWNLVTGENMISESWAQMLGFTADEVRHTYDFFLTHVHPEDLKRMEKIRELYIKGELAHYHSVFRMRTKEGQEKWILSRGKTVEWNEHGQPTRMVGTHQDITRRKQAEISLRYQKSVLESLFRYSPEALAHLNTRQEIVRINQQFTRLFGYTEAECVGVSLDPLITDEALLKEAALVSCRTQSNEFVEMESVRVRKDGSRVPVIVRGGPVIVDDEIVGYQAIYTDITQRKKEELELREAKERAEAASQVKSQFLSNMSHEIRTPMNGIYGAAMMLESTPLSQEQLELVNILTESAGRMVETMNNLLDVARIESQRIELREEVFELIQTLEEVMEPFRVLGESKNVPFTFEASEACRVKVVGDRSKLTRVLYHLLSNAFKFTETGKVTLEAELVQYENPFGIYRFSVADTGIGIASEDQQKLFQRFTQLDDSYSKSYQGTGLGLAIVQKLVELMGGTVSLSSAPGEGSRFYFEVPLRVHELHAGNGEAASQKQQFFPHLKESIRILAVEDDEISQILLRKICRKLGAQVDLAQDGFEAIRMFGTTAYDLVLMDVQLPTISGIEVTSVIRSFEKKFGERTPIIGISAHALKQDKERCLAAGMNDYLSKPIDMEKLYQVIQEWVVAQDSTSVLPE